VTYTVVTMVVGPGQPGRLLVELVELDFVTVTIVVIVEVRKDSEVDTGSRVTVLVIVTMTWES
jgi:hypothetical protein